MISRDVVDSSRPQTEPDSNLRSDCPNCGSTGELLDFHNVADVPVHSVLLMQTRDEALTFPRRPISLSFCQRCGFIFNRAFDPAIHEYSERYEETQGYSETFNQFSHRLALDLLERHDLRGKHILEIGCGKGEFLTHICELGDCTGIGFDPAYVPERTRAKPSDSVTFIQDFYSEKYAGHTADLICCKMTLEHINETGALVRMLRNSLENSPDTVIFFQIPDVERVLEECGFWDIYYEHCSYFSAASLRYLFERSGFEVLDVWTDFDDQYLMLEARPATVEKTPATADRHAVDRISRLVNQFTEQIGGIKSGWTNYLGSAARAGRRVVLWGGGSKAVAFLTTLEIGEEIALAVDINPNKHGTFLPGTGHPVAGPDELLANRPDVVVVMNPIYCDEIRESLASMGLFPEIIPITNSPMKSD